MGKQETESEIRSELDNLRALVRLLRRHTRRLLKERADQARAQSGPVELSLTPDDGTWSRVFAAAALPSVITDPANEGDPGKICNSAAWLGITMAETMTATLRARDAVKAATDDQD